MHESEGGMEWGMGTSFAESPPLMPESSRPSRLGAGSGPLGKVKTLLFGPASADEGLLWLLY